MKIDVCTCNILTQKTISFCNVMTQICIVILFLGICLLKMLTIVIVIYKYTQNMNIYITEKTIYLCNLMTKTLFEEVVYWKGKHSFFSALQIHTKHEHQLF